MPQDGDAELLDGSFLVRLERLRLRVRRRLAGHLRAERRSRRTGSSLEFADHRNYAPGDDPRRIDWSIFGRSERLMMKLYEEEESLDVSLLIDGSASMRWLPPGPRHGSKFDLARQLAAALSLLALHGMDRVRLWYFDAALGEERGPFRGKNAIHDVLRFLRGGSAANGATDFFTSLTRFGRSQRRRGLAVVFTDGFDPAGYEKGLSAVAGRHFALHVVHLMEAGECEPRESGDLLLRDCEDGGELAVVASPALLRAYRGEVAAFREEFKSWCGRHAAGYSFALAETDFEDIVMQAFRRDGLVR